MAERKVSRFPLTWVQKNLDLKEPTKLTFCVLWSQSSTSWQGRFYFGIATEVIFLLFRASSHSMLGFQILKKQLNPGRRKLALFLLCWAFRTSFYCYQIPKRHEVYFFIQTDWNYLLFSDFSEESGFNIVRCTLSPCTEFVVQKLRQYWISEFHWW